MCTSWGAVVDAILWDMREGIEISMLCSQGAVYKNLFPLLQIMTSLGGKIGSPFCHIWLPIGLPIANLFGLPWLQILISAYFCPPNYIIVEKGPLSHFQTTPSLKMILGAVHHAMDKFSILLCGMRAYLLT